MPAGIKPQVRVFQEFNSAPAETVDALRPAIVGPEYDLHRYSEASEKVKAGSFDPDTPVTFSWTSDLARRAGAVVDQSYTRVYAEDAYFSYWTDLADSNTSGAVNTDTTGETINTLSGDPNRIRVVGVALASGNGYDAHADFASREVRVGDYVKITSVVDGTSYEVDAEILELEAAPGSATDFSAESFSAGASNKNSQSASAPSDTTNSGTFSTFTTSISGSYDGVKVGVLNETYTVTVREGSVGGDASTMVIDVVSASGKDDLIGVSPAGADFASNPVAVGANGLQIAFVPSGGDTDVAAGAESVITVSQDYILPSLTAQGTYTGDTDTTYIITIVEGGDASDATEANRPLVSVTTSNGVDGASPFRLPQADGSTFASVGLYGLEIRAVPTDGGTGVPGTVYVTGDQFSIDASAGTSGQLEVIRINKSLNSALITDSSQTISLGLSFMVKVDSIEIPERTSDGLGINWTQDTSGITIDNNAVAAPTEYDGSTELSLVAGDLYIHWRELVQERTDAVFTIGSIADIDSVFDTPNDPDNPLVFGVYCALLNTSSQSAGTGGAPSVRAVGVKTDDLTGYQTALNLLAGRDDLYSIVPLTFDSTIQAAVQGHVSSLSTAEKGQWRIGLMALKHEDPSPVLETNNSGTDILATVDSSGLLTASDVTFITDGVRSGDYVRINYGYGPDGDEVYETYTVDNVNSETQLQLLTAPEPPIGVAVKMEVWRPQSSSDLVAQVGAKAGTFSDRRAYTIFPGYVEYNGELVPSYYLTAAIGGLIGSVAPHQGLTNTEIIGFTDVDPVMNNFTDEQITELGGYGVMVVLRDPQTGRIYIRHQLSTDTTDTNTQELSITKNVDSVSYYFLRILQPAIGRANISQAFLEQLRSNLLAGISALTSVPYGAMLGPQLLDAEIKELRQHATLADRLVAVITITPPVPFNNMDLTLVV